MFLSKKPVVQTWQGMKLPPRMPTKNRMVTRPWAVVTVPARAVGIAPTRRMPTNVHLAPNLSHRGPAARRTNIAAARAMTSEFAMSLCDSLRSLLIVSVKRGGKAYQLQKATKKPHQESKKTRPYVLKGFRAGMDLALWLTGLMFGAFHSTEGDIAGEFFWQGYVEAGSQLHLVAAVTWMSVEEEQQCLMPDAGDQTKIEMQVIMVARLPVLASLMV